MGGGGGGGGVLFDGTGPFATTCIYDGVGYGAGGGAGPGTAGGASGFVYVEWD